MTRVSFTGNVVALPIRGKLLPRILIFACAVLLVGCASTKGLTVTTALENAGSEAESRIDEATAERLRQLEEHTQSNTSRVVVLQWAETDADHENTIVQGKIRKTIRRKDVKFLPQIDLYQAGRRMPDKTIRARDQLGTVPDDVKTTLEPLLSAVEVLEWDAMTPSEWQLKAAELREAADLIWFLDRPDLRGTLFRLYAMTGFAAENGNLTSTPWYAEVAGHSVNYYRYLAATLALRSPELLNLLPPNEYDAIDYLVQGLQSGEIGLYTLSFENSGIFEPRSFATDYIVQINGVETLINHPKGLLEVPRGFIDIELLRADGGHGLSARVDVLRMQDQIHFVLDTAKRRMGREFIDQLMQHPYECSPAVTDDILASMAIYQELHPQAEIYVAVPMTPRIDAIAFADEAETDARSTAKDFGVELPAWMDQLSSSKRYLKKAEVLVWRYDGDRAILNRLIFEKKKKKKRR